MFQEIICVLGKINLSRYTLLSGLSQNELLGYLAEAIRTNADGITKRGYSWNFTGIDVKEIGDNTIVYGKLYKEKIEEERISILNDDKTDIIETKFLPPDTPYSHFVIDLNSENIVFESHSKIKTYTFCRMFSQIIESNNPFLKGTTLIPKTIDNIDEVLSSFKTIQKVTISSVFPNGLNNFTFSSLREELEGDRDYYRAEGKDLKVKDSFVEDHMKQSPKGYNKYLLEGLDHSDRYKKIKSEDNIVQNKRYVPDRKKESVFGEFLDFLLTYINR